ncbi:hypothetical protein ACFV4M_01955 [Kitasatospora indigofera]|uniref:hypothetical protein n=1 Tax=Kitasatospora indigofera TaxID=67307 RepID=UPI003655E530
MTEREWIVIEFDTRKTGTYISAECQLDVHHGCPGGVRDEALAGVLVCRCTDADCGCSRPRRSVKVGGRAPGAS